MSLPSLDHLRARAVLYRRIREFFLNLDYLEVDTPVLGAATGTDAHIQSIEAVVNGARGYLQTSPELYMKRLLAAGSGSIYQIGHAFRDEEQGCRHRPEFSLLEWYAEGFDYRTLMDQMETLIDTVTQRRNVFTRISYHACYRDALDLNPASVTIDEIRSVVDREVGNIDADLLDIDACLDLLMSAVISKRFKEFTFVFDYPVSQSSLARIRPGKPSVAERFELFFGDLELANGFTELTDAAEQRKRFEQDNLVRRRLGLKQYPLDERFLAALECEQMPECAGVALGLDRLLMVMTGQQDIQRVSIQ